MTILFASILSDTSIVSFDYLLIQCDDDGVTGIGLATTVIVFLVNIDLLQHDSGLGVLIPILILLQVSAW